MAKITPGIVSPPHEVLTPEEWRKLGRARRKRVSRSSHAEWDPPPDRPDPVAILQEQEKSRLSDVVEIRHSRMAASQFPYFRGAAAAMAWDLAHTPTTDIRVQACGDAHLLNFGLFAAPDRRLVFDVNDFDETLPASVRVGRQAAGRERGRSPRAITVSQIDKDGRRRVAQPLPTALR